GSRTPHEAVRQLSSKCGGYGICQHWFAERRDESQCAGRREGCDPCPTHQVCEGCVAEQSVLRSTRKSAGGSDRRVRCERRPPGQLKRQRIAVIQSEIGILRWLGPALVSKPCLRSCVPSVEAEIPE